MREKREEGKGDVGEVPEDKDVAGTRGSWTLQDAEFETGTVS